MKKPATVTTVPAIKIVLTIQAMSASGKRCKIHMQIFICTVYFKPRLSRILVAEISCVA